MSGPTLDALRDIHLPPAPLLTTVLPEWSIAAAVLALLAAAVWGVQRYLRRRRLQAALRTLRRLAAAHACDGDATRLASGLSQLLRSHALASFPQPGIAGLTGAAWLDFLDAHGGNGAFRDGAGAALACRPYQPDGAYDAAALIALVRRWLLANPC